MFIEVYLKFKTPGTKELKWNSDLFEIYSGKPSFYSRYLPWLFKWIRNFLIVFTERGIKNLLRKNFVLWLMNYAKSYNFESIVQSLSLIKYIYIYNKELSNKINMKI